MNIIKTDIDGLLVIEPKVFGDARGYFMEVFSERDFRAATGLDVHFVQDNESMSARGVLRGLHFQKVPHAQSKLVRVARGAVQDVAVDLRAGSQTFGKYVSVVLSGDNKRMFYIPEGFAHGFLTLEDKTVFQYKCGAFYEPSSEGSVPTGELSLRRRCGSRTCPVQSRRDVWPEPGTQRSVPVLYRSPDA